VIAEERVLVLADLDGRTTELGDQDLVADLDGGSNALAITVEGTGANGENLGLVELLDGRLGEEDATGGLGLGLDALDQDAVEQGNERLDGLGGDGGLRVVLAACFAHEVVGQQVKHTILTVEACDKEFWQREVCKRCDAVVDVLLSVENSRRDSAVDSPRPGV
jgi:hypothetical protein